MDARAQIPEVQGIEDVKVKNILTIMRAILNNITGRNSGTIPMLNGNADLGGVINTVNKILNQIQDTRSEQSSVPLSTKNRTWRDVTTNRAAATSYYNNTNQEIILSIGCAATVTGNTNAEITISEFAQNFWWYSNAGVASFRIVLPVPAGEAYSVSALNNASIGSWFEYRAD